MHLQPYMTEVAHPWSVECLFLPLLPYIPYVQILDISQSYFVTMSIVKKKKKVNNMARLTGTAISEVQQLDYDGLQQHYLPVKPTSFYPQLMFDHTLAATSFENYTKCCIETSKDRFLHLRHLADKGVCQMTNTE